MKSYERCPSVPEFFHLCIMFWRFILVAAYVSEMIFKRKFVSLSERKKISVHLYRWKVMFKNNAHRTGG